MSGCTSLTTESSPRGSATIQLAATTDGIVVDTISLERGPDGQNRRGHTVARLSVLDVARLRGLLGEMGS